MFEKSYTHVAVVSAYFESKLPRSRTSKLTRIQNIRMIINYQTVRLVSTFGSGSCVSSFGSSPKVETAAVSSFGLTQKWKLRTRFQFWAYPKVETADTFPVLGRFHFWACTIVFGVGQMRSGLLCVEDLRRHAKHRMSLDLRMSVLFVCRGGGYVSCWDMQNDN